MIDVELVLNDQKTGGQDVLIAGLLIIDMMTTETWLLSLFRSIWEQEKALTVWKQGLIVKIP